MEELDIGSVTGGARLRLVVKAGARREGILGVHGGALKVCVREPAERGRANRAVIELLSAALGLPRRALVITAGLSSRNKTLQVTGLDADGIRSRLRSG